MLRRILLVLRDRRREVTLIVGATLATIGSMLAVYAAASLFATSLIVALETQWGVAGSDATPSWIFLILGLAATAAGIALAVYELRNPSGDSSLDADTDTDVDGASGPTESFFAPALPFDAVPTAPQAPIGEHDKGVAPA